MQSSSSQRSLLFTVGPCRKLPRPASLTTVTWLFFPKSFAHKHRPTITFQQIWYATIFSFHECIIVGLLSGICMNPHRAVCWGPVASMGLLCLQGETATTKQDQHREGSVWARGKSMGSVQLISWSNTIVVTGKKKTKSGDCIQALWCSLEAFLYVLGAFIATLFVC